MICPATIAFSRITVTHEFGNYSMTNLLIGS